MAQVTIRLASNQDAPAVIALWRTCGLVVSNNDPERDFNFALSKPGSDILLALDGAETVGSIMVGHDGHRGWLYYVAVDHKSRRLGIGRALVASAEAWLKKRDVAKVQLMVRESNAEVAAFYERLGYQLMPRINFQKWLNP